MRKLIPVLMLATVVLAAMGLPWVPAAQAGEATSVKRFEQHLTRAQTEREAEHYASAVTHYRKALSLDPRHAQARYELGETYRRWGKYYEARKSFRLAQMLNASDRKWEGQCRMKLASCWEAAGQYRQALLEYQLALHADPGLSEAEAASKRMADAERKQRDD